MYEISIMMTVPYVSTGRYLPIIKALNDHICCCYGIGYPRRYIFSDEPVEKMKLTKITTRIASYMIRPLCKILHLPQYYVYWTNIRLLDLLYSRRAANDDSKIILTNALLYKTVAAAKKAGKIVVLEAGNAEPEREHMQVAKEYQQFGIKHIHIYGNKKYMETVKKSLGLADHIISISKVSERTYESAGYNMNKFHRISLTGTDFPIRKNITYSGKEQVFITTAFHNFVKGTHRLLLAWKKAQICDKKLLVVGTICEDIQEFIQKYGPFENVEFIGHRSNLREWYLQYDAVGILMSLSEGAVRVTPEMMSFGFPMIVSLDATCDIVQDGYNGRVVDPLNENVLIATLQYFAEDWNRVHALQQNVLHSISHRTLTDYSMELARFLETLI